MRPRRNAAVSLAPAALALGALAASGTPSRAAGAGAPWWVLPSLVVCLAMASLHRPAGGSTLGLGALCLPPALVVTGAAGAGWVAAVGFVLGGLARRLLWHLAPGAPEERRGLMRLAEGAGHTVLATLAAGWAWRAAGTFDPLAALRAVSWPRALAGAAAYLLVAAVLVELAERLRRPRRWLLSVRLLRPLAFDLAGWTVGVLLALVGVTDLGGEGAAGWAVATGLLWAFGLLGFEASRMALLQGAFERRAVDLERLSQASRRMAGSGFGMAALAVQIRKECLRVVDASYFQLVLEEVRGDGDSAGGKSWWLGPDGAIHGGAPEPGESPPPLPGIHRRRPWRIVERTLEAEDRRLARLRLWCDPRRLESGNLELLDRLLPQLGTLVHRALLDREAREDPLTGVPVRRLLERALADAFVRCRETGGTLSVVMCDLDHFKSINDSHGHAAGDRALKAVARTLEAHGREDDVCARYGGEEFALLLDRTDGATALAVAERLRRAVEGLVLEEGGEEVPLTASLGVASFPELWAAAPGELVALADEALYAAKEAGRNRVLLNLGRRRFRGVDGEVVRAAGDDGNGDEDAAPEAPRIFA